MPPLSMNEREVHMAYIIVKDSKPASYYCGMAAGFPDWVTDIRCAKLLRKREGAEKAMGEIQPFCVERLSLRRVKGDKP